MTSFPTFVHYFLPTMQSDFECTTNVHSLKHYFPQSNAEKRRAGKERVWMRDAVYIVLISALKFIPYIIYIKIYYVGNNSV